MNEDDKKTVQDNDSGRPHPDPALDRTTPSQGEHTPLQLGLKGKKIGQYRLIHELGQGGQGYVYLAEDEKLHRQVALKVLLEAGRMSNAARLRFEREAEAASKLDHSGIARVFEIGEHEGLAFIAFEYVQGSNLAHYINQSGSRATDGETGSEVYISFTTEDPVRPGQQDTLESDRDSNTDRKAILSAVRYVESAARALHSAHEVGLIHRDIKPANLMVRDDGSACVLDFGLAKDTESQEDTLTQTGDLVGTPAYMSPEQLLANPVKLDRRTDIYSLGVVLFEACTLRRPFVGANRQELYRAIALEEPPNPRSINPKVPVDLTAIILTAIDKDRGRRYPTALEFAEDLRRFREYEPVNARPAGPWVKTMRWLQRNPILAGSSLLVFAAILAVAIVSHVKGEEARFQRDKAETALVERSNALQAEKKAKEEKSLALTEIERLADVKKYQDAITEAESLWPARPEKLNEIEAWLATYKELSEALGGHEESLLALRATADPYTEEARLKEHAKSLKEIEAINEVLRGGYLELKKKLHKNNRTQIEKIVAFKENEREALVAKTQIQATWTFSGDSVKRWKHDVLEDLVANLKLFSAPKSGTYADVKKRQQSALTIQAQTIDNQKELWNDTIAAVKSSDKYAGFVMGPQLGLIPMGKDPESGLEEFLHWETHEGEIPKRDKSGRFKLTGKTGLIMVLIPPGEVWSGGQNKDPKGQNYDPEHHSDERLRGLIYSKPFLMSKYEMTQGQWLRSPSEIKNPSYYGAGYKGPGTKAPVDLTHPVEQVSWVMCMENLGRMGLTVADQDRWEFTARAGATSIWPGGVNSKDQLGQWGNIAGLETKSIFNPHESSFNDGHVIHAPVGQYRANAFGLHDVMGNLSEWSSTKAGRNARLDRGGAFSDAAIDARLACRYGNVETQRNGNLGVRPYCEVSVD